MIDNTYSVKYTDEYYTIYKPYKKGVGNNYILNNNVVNFDTQTIEKNLIQISTNEFDVDKYYYQEGQYLSLKELKKLLSSDELNNYKKKKIDGKNINPELLASIYEKNFLDKKGNIKGISLGLVLNQYQSYDSNNNYVVLDKDEVIEFGKDAGEKIVKYLRENNELDDIPILVALYLENSPETNVSGNYLYYGITTNNNIKYKYINQKNFYMNNLNVKELDQENYRNFEKFVESIKEYDKSINISGLGHFNGKKLSKIDIVATNNSYSYGDLLYINQLLSDKAIKYFDDIKIIIEVRTINKIRSYIVKEASKTTTDIFIY